MSDRGRNARSRIQCKQRKGAALVIIAFTMITLIGMVAFAYDVGHMFLVRAQLQTAVDAGALAASLKLKTTRNVTSAEQAAKDFVQLNRVGAFVTVPEGSISVETGTWDSSTGVFSVGGSDPDAVRVTGQLTDEPLFFAAVLGREVFSVPRTAIANGGGSSLDVMLTLDLSGSMEDNGRIKALQAAAPEFVNVLEDVGDHDRIGVMGYGAQPDHYDPHSKGHTGTEYLLAPSEQYPVGSGREWVGVLEADLTLDFDDLRNNVLTSSVLLADKYNSYTPTGAAIRDSANYLDQNARSSVDKVIVLMSDGHANRPNTDPDVYAKDMADWAKEMNITIYTISCGNDADEDLMADIASRTGGEHFIANGTGSELEDALTEVFQDVAKSIKKTQLVK